MTGAADASPPKSPLKYQVCTRTVMDTTDPDITFDENGVCNYWREFEALQATQPGAEERERRLEKLIAEEMKQVTGGLPLPPGFQLPM